MPGFVCVFIFVFASQSPEDIERFQLIGKILKAESQIGPFAFEALYINTDGRTDTSTHLNARQKAGTSNKFDFAVWHVGRRNQGQTRKVRGKPPDRS